MKKRIVIVSPFYNGLYRYSLPLVNELKKYKDYELLLHFDNSASMVGSSERIKDLNLPEYNDIFDYIKYIEIKKKTGNNLFFLYILYICFRKFDIYFN